MAPPQKVKLIYFEGRGRGELPRILLAAAGIKYENCRLSREDFVKVKPTLPFGQGPTLDWGGVMVAQSMAMCRLIANEGGLAGADPLENARIDMVVDHAVDHFNSVIPIMGAKTDEDKKAECDKFIKEKVPSFLEKAEELLKKSGGKYFVGNKLTWADIVIADRLWALNDKEDPLYINFLGASMDHDARVGLVAKYPTLTDLANRVAATPNIKKWLSERPASKDEKF